jgi:hypothetical protein
MAVVSNMTFFKDIMKAVSGAPRALKIVSRKVDNWQNIFTIMTTDQNFPLEVATGPDNWRILRISHYNGTSPKVKLTTKCVHSSREKDVRRL